MRLVPVVREYSKLKGPGPTISISAATVTTESQFEGGLVVVI